jgi:hypothetical protein
LDRYATTAAMNARRPDPTAMAVPFGSGTASTVSARIVQIAVLDLMRNHARVMAQAA